MEQFEEKNKGGRPTKREEINRHISEALRKDTPEVLAKLKESASRGERPVKQYQYAGISERAYYTWMANNPELKQELTKLLKDFRKAKIKEAALLGAPAAEQRKHANFLTEKDYNELMTDDPDFAHEIEMTQKSNVKLWSRKNIVQAIQNGSVSDAWRFLEHMDPEFSRGKEVPMLQQTANVNVMNIYANPAIQGLLKKHQEEFKAAMSKMWDNPEFNPEISTQEPAKTTQN